MSLVRLQRAPAFGGRCAVLACLAVVLSAAAASREAVARPAQFEDLLQREAFGTVIVAPGDRVLAERRTAISKAPRFDYGRFNVMFRNRLVEADVAAGGELRPLLRQESGVGYALGPASPGGRYVVVYRLKLDHYQLGIVDLPRRTVRWLAVTPEVQLATRTVQWASPSVLLAIGLQPTPGRAAAPQPYDLRATRPQWRLPPRWAATARGEASATEFGSGSYIDEHKRGPQKAVVSIRADTGVVSVLSRGEAIDIEASSSGRWLAILQADDPIRLIQDHTVEGDFGLSVRRARLSILDLTNGRQTEPCPHCDVSTSLLAWSADNRLLIYARDDGAAWTAGRLMQVDSAAGAVAPIATDVTTAIAGRPERIAAGWWGGDIVAFGRRPGDKRDDWYSLAPTGPVRLTADLAHPQRQGVVTVGPWLLIAADNVALKIDRSGHSERLTPRRFEVFRPPAEGVATRMSFAVEGTAGLPGVLGEGDHAEAGLLRPDGELAGATNVTGMSVRLVAMSYDGAATIKGTEREPQTLAWRQGAAPARTLAVINQTSEPIEWPRAVRVEQRLADGTLLRHWVLLPAGAPARHPLPLVVIPYPGEVFGAAPPESLLHQPMWPGLALTAAGYAVLVPSLPSPRNGRGPTEGLSDRVLAAVEAAAATPALDGWIDPNRLGAWGHSFGGLGAIAMISQTDRFAAAVAVEARTDLISSWGQFTPSRRMNPDDGPSTYYSAGWVEDFQGDMRAPPWAAVQRYVANSPFFSADRIHTPLMLVAGDMDADHLGQAEEMFSALYRQDKDCVLLTYWGEQHLFASPGNLRDLYRRGLDFLDQHLRPEALMLRARSARSQRPGSAPATIGPSSPRPLPG